MARISFGKISVVIFAMTVFAELLGLILGLGYSGYVECRLCLEYAANLMPAILFRVVFLLYILGCVSVGIHYYVQKKNNLGMVWKSIGLFFVSALVGVVVFFMNIVLAIWLLQE